VQADTIPGNQASEALLRRLGFQEEGLRRGAGYWKNSFHDLKCFGLLRTEFL
jgi:ribosomal-protein-alanine N-acetyltransferase